MIKRVLSSQAVGMYLPVLTEQALATLVTMLGTILVSSLGAAAVSGVGLVDSINYLFMNMMVAIGTGVTAVVSRYIGAGKIHDAKRAAAYCITLSVYASVIMGAVMFILRVPMLSILFGGAEAEVLDAAKEYMIYTAVSLPMLTVFNVLSGIRRGSGDNFTPLIGSLVSNIIYVCVALICINILKLGVMSVGLGLLTSRIVSAGVLWYFVRYRPRTVKVSVLPIKLNFKELKPVLDIAVPSAMDTVVFNGGKIIVQVFMSGMGTASLAANSICNSLATFQQLPAKTLQITAVTLTGRAYGEKDYKKARKIMLLQTAYAMVSQVVMSVLFVVGFRGLMSLFTADAEIINISRRLIILICAAVPVFWPSSFVTPQALRATGDAKFTMRISMLSMLLCRIICSWVFGVYLNWGIFGIWFAMVLDWIFRSAFYIPRVFSSAWIDRDRS